MKDTEKRRIIIIEKEKKYRDKLSDFFKGFGFEVHIFEYAKDGLKAYLERKPFMFIIDPFFNEDGVQGIDILAQFSINNAELEKDEKVILLVYSNSINKSSEKILKDICDYYIGKEEFMKLKKIIVGYLEEGEVQLIQHDAAYKSEISKAPIKKLFEGINYKNSREVLELLDTYNDKIDGSDDEVKSVRREKRTMIIRNFWKLYTEVAKKYIKSDDKAKQFEEIAFLRFRAILREDWIAPEQITSFLNNIKESYRFKNVKNVFYADEWLTALYNGEIVPTYNDILVSEYRRVRDLYPQLRDTKLNSDKLYYTNLAKYLGIIDFEEKKKTARKAGEMFELKSEEDIFEKGKELLFENEINEMFRALTNTCIGAQGNKMPVFNMKESIEITNSLVSKMDVLKISRSIEQVDPGIFRRVRLKKENHVPPYFILVPCVANRGICWDPWHDSNKSLSPGRVAIPVMPEVSLEKTILYALGSLRWRTAKQIADVYWMEEGLTGAFYNYFEENKKRLDEDGQPYLSSKDSLEDCFIKDYEKWILAEAKGQLKLRKEVREIFWFNIPFPENVKESLRGRGQIFEELLRKDERRSKSRFTS